MSLTAHQHSERSRGLGGSDCAAALGLSKWKTAHELYLEKRGELGRDYDTETEEMWWGRMLEPVVRQKFAERTGRVVRLPQETLWHPKYDFMCANVDGVSEQEDGTDPRGYEGKTALMSIGWGEEGTDAIPNDYLMQVHHYLIVTGLPVFDVATLIGRRFAYYEVEPDPELHEMIIEGERDFMRRVRKGDPPPIDYSHSTAIDLVKRIFPGTNGARIEAPADMQAVREQMHGYAEIETAMKRAKEACKAQLLEFMGEAALLSFPDGKCYRRLAVEKTEYLVAATSYMESRFINDPELKKAKGARRK